MFCFIIGHKYKIVKRFNRMSRCVHCERCGTFWAMNDEMKAFVPWSGEFGELYDWDPFEWEWEQEKKIRQAEKLVHPPKDR